MSTPKPYKIEECLRIDGGHLKRAITIPAEEFKKINDVLYIHLTTSELWATALFLPSTRTDTDSRPLSHTSFFEDIRVLRDAAINAIIETDNQSTLEIFEEQTMTRYARKKQIKSKKPSIPDVVEVKLAAAPGMEELPLRVWVGGQSSKTKPVFVEITPDSLSLIAAACKNQYENGDFKRPRQAKRKVAMIQIPRIL